MTKKTKDIKTIADLTPDGVTYKAWLCWFDERKCLEDEAAVHRSTFDVKKYTGNGNE